MRMILATMTGPVVGRVTGAVLLPLALAGCLKPDEVAAEHGWVRLPAVAGRPAAGYVTLHGGMTPARLVNVSADHAIRTEMHESMGGTGTAMATMRPLAAVDLPAHGTVAFAPGGRHLMLFGVSPSLKPGDATLLTFTFADGSHLQRKAWAIGAGDAAPD